MGKKETVQETKKTREVVDEDRKYLIQAAIVRIMKLARCSSTSTSFRKCSVMLEISDLGLSTWKRFFMEPFKETLVRLDISEKKKDRN